MRAYILVVFVAIAATHAMAFSDSGWIPIRDAVDVPLVQDLGRWAVQEHNRGTGEHVVYTKTVDASQQSDDKAIYFQLIIEGAVRAGGNNHFKAVLTTDGYDIGQRQLVSFDAAA